VGGKLVEVAETEVAVGAKESDMGVGPQADAAAMHMSRAQVIVWYLLIALASSVTAPLA
jgi:hypothetical protein